MPSNNPDRPYTILPINFHQSNGKILISTDHGDFVWIEIKDFDLLLKGELDVSSVAYRDLKSKQIIATDIALAVDVAAAKLRTRKHFLTEFTSLHMMVITVRCNQKCEYCQISCEDEDLIQYDMDTATATSIVNTIFKTPSDNVKIEFQGGEPTLNWKVVVHVINYARKVNEIYNKNLSFVICTNLTAIKQDQLDFLNENDVYISTSLDGPKDIHDFGRKLRVGESSYDAFLKNLSLAKEINGEDRISALMTTTRYSLNNHEKIIDEYLANGIDSLFIRDLNPYGFAAEEKAKLGYESNEFVDFYIKCFEYILNLNKKGTIVREYYAILLFTRIMTSQSTGFVDLQSPSGAGISGVIYDYNGDVYPADEARMLARMGDDSFRMGNTKHDSFQKIFGGHVARNITKNSCLESIPGCSDCVYKPYCGADPFRNYLHFGDIVGRQPESDFCKKNKAIFDYFFNLIMEDNSETLDILWSWITPSSNREVIHETI